MKMVMISADDYEKLSNAKKESETKIESYKQCIAGYESRIKELTEERDKLKDQYRATVAKKVLNSAYGVEQDICCRISKSLDASMFDKISQLSDENEKLKKKSAEKSEWLKAKNEALDNLIIGYNKLEKEYKELKASTVSFDCHKGLIEDNEKLATENHKLKIEVSSLETQLKDCKYMYENKLKNTEVALKAALIDNDVKDSFIKTFRSQAEKTLRGQAEEDANKMKELRQKYEAVLKANEKLATENTRLNNELNILKKHFKDLDNAYKSQKNELLKLKNKPIYVDYEKIKISYIEAVNEKERLERELSDAAIKATKICINASASSDTIKTLAGDLEKYMK